MAFGQKFAFSLDKKYGYAKIGGSTPKLGVFY
jgi:hypothetical protein